ncbi:MAG TPA: class I SAM-dependent methyltransferase [Phycisphaerales bacterium]|nr:class I SAM-dependent methyltransferase [Phycisphaerales bacterium]
MASTTIPNERLEHDFVIQSGFGRASSVGDATLILDRPAGMDEWLLKFEGIYRDAAGDHGKIPWAHKRPCPSLVSWLNAEGPKYIRPGARAAVVGCGLGEDACLLAERGYEVTAFDCCPSAIEHARKLHPEYCGMFVEADLLRLPAKLVHRFDLVVEVHTLQALPPHNRHALASGMSRLLSPRGVLVAIARGRDDSIPVDSLQGPPFPFTAKELTDLMASCGLAPVRPVDDFTDDNSPPVRRLRGAFQKSA